jgi:hypothetical protein
MRKIEITITEDGATTTDYLSFEGAACLAASKELHALLAQFGVQAETSSTTPKPELLAALQQQEVSTQDIQSQQQGGIS